MTTNEHLKELLLKHIRGTIAAPERDHLYSLLAKDEYAGQWKEVILQLSMEVQFNEMYNEEEWEPVIQNIIGRPIPSVHRVHFLRTSWFRYAAAVILLIGGAAIWYTNNDNHQGNALNNNVAVQTISPGTNKAVLTVGNKTIDLSSSKTGIAVGSAITYDDGERIADAGQMLQLATPRGGQYQAVLPDGSKVWLNAASSVSFPSRFTGDTREIEITGEAYLEIAKNTRQPFIVHTSRTTVQVLGTSFNVNAYADEEAEKTTLVEGSIKVGDMLLKPGEQAIADQKGQLIKKSVQVEEFIAWKDGLFRFNRVSIEPIMRQLSRWYDLEVVYKGNVNERFISTVPRDMPVSQVLEALELTKAVKFEIEGKKIMVIGK